MSDEQFVSPVSHRPAHEKQAKAFLAVTPMLRKAGFALLVCSFVLPRLCTLCGLPIRYATLTLVFCQGAGLALLTRKFRLWLPITTAILLPAWFWPKTLHLIDLWGLYTLALIAPALVFVRSLLPKHEPLITKFAHQIHGTLRPDIRRYTYYLTWFWSLFFIIALLAPFLLWAYGPRGIWQWPLNGGTLALAAIFLVLEYGIRRLVIRNFEHASLRTSIDLIREQP